MKVKIDTKEKFHVISVQEPILSANMTAELTESCLAFLKSDIKNIILNLSETDEVTEEAAEKLVGIQQQFYENNSSFVFCGLKKGVESILDKEELLELMNVTPTESEAMDIIQMEEIERELLNEDNEEGDDQEKSY